MAAFFGAFEEFRCRCKAHRSVRGEPPERPDCIGLAYSAVCGDSFNVSHSIEGGEHAGLGVLPGEVVRFDLPQEYKVPHMGWNQTRICQPAPLLKGIADGTYFYFVHSYYAKPADRSCVALEADYPDPFCAMVWRDNLYATQFHPEKSQRQGLAILRNFAELT